MCSCVVGDALPDVPDVRDSEVLSDDVACLCEAAVAVDEVEVLSLEVVKNFPVGICFVEQEFDEALDSGAFVGPAVMLCGEDELTTIFCAEVKEFWVSAD